jgi:hypothetical protein
MASICLKEVMGVQPRLASFVFQALLYRSADPACQFSVGFDSS